MTDTHVAWSLEKGVLHNLSPLLVGDELYLVSDRGVAMLLDAASGEEIWQGTARRKLFRVALTCRWPNLLLNEAGETTVIELGREYKQLAKNLVDRPNAGVVHAVGGPRDLSADRYVFVSD